MNSQSYIKAFITSTVHVLKIMAFVEAKAGKPYAKKDNIPKGDISGIIGMTGASDGTMSLSFNTNCILAIVSSMFGEKFEAIDSEIEDAVGELTNMICGDARRRLEEEGILLKGAIPTVVKGNGHLLRHITNNSVVAIPFKTSGGSFVLEVSLAL